MRTSHKIQSAALSAALATTLFLTGCGTPGAPQPPSLSLPEPVSNLAANRAGDQVTLTWIMPKRNTDKLLLKDNVAVRVCRKQAAACDSAGADLSFAPGSDAAYTDTLPAALTAGPPRPLSYFVDLINHNGRSAGLSNAAQILAGAAPSPVSGLSAELRKQGVLLLWLPDATPDSAIRLRRKLLTPSAAKPNQGLLAPQPEPVDQNLLIDACAAEGHPGLCRAIDKNIRIGQTYEYRAQRVARVTVDNQTLELAGELSPPVRVHVLDVFPPAAPTALAAVATIGENGSAPAIDLSWQPVAESDLAGYAVYRREADASWQRISPAEPLVPPAFHDSQVQQGHTYHYAVSAIDQGGHESPRSTEAEETVPNP